MAAKQKLNKPIIFNSTFSTYTATEIIGEGGSGRIFKAEDDAGTTHAIKWLDPNKMTREKIKRFKNELYFCLKNQHPNILTITDHGTFINGEVNSPFYVMPLYDGSLRDLLNTGISPDRILIYFSVILDGVEAAHMQGVIHRDLKPENILYLADGDHLIVADFGIAHFEEDEIYTAVETKDTTRLANFQYSAPEQRSRGANQNQCTDIYALGLILNEMFTGNIPSGTGYKTIAKVAPDYEYLDSIVEEMLRQSPQDRPDSVEKIKNLLIGRQNEFITRQRVSELKDTVIPITEVDDPLITDPIRIVNFDWSRGILALYFQQPVNAEWIQAFRNIGSYTSLAGKGPNVFAFKGDKAIIQAKEGQVQQIIDHFHSWLPKANSLYEIREKQKGKEEEEKQRKELQQQIDEQEARQRVLRSTKLPNGQ